MKKFVIEVVSDDAIEILPGRSGSDVCSSAVCLCCERADQPMDDDGCGICDTCLGLSVRMTDRPEIPAPLSLTIRNR